MNDWFASNITEIAFAWVATIMAIFGRDMAMLVKRLLGTAHFVLRLTVFVFLCAFGFGMATILLSGWVKQGFQQLPKDYLWLWISLACVLLAIVADRRNAI